MTHTTVINIECTASAVFFCQVLSFRERAEVKKDINVSYLLIFNAENYIHFQISASGLFLKYS